MLLLLYAAITLLFAAQLSAACCRDADAAPLREAMPRHRSRCRRLLTRSAERRRLFHYYRPLLRHFFFTITDFVRHFSLLRHFSAGFHFRHDDISPFHAFIFISWLRQRCHAIDGCFRLPAARLMPYAFIFADAIAIIFIITILPISGFRHYAISPLLLMRYFAYDRHSAFAAITPFIAIAITPLIFRHISPAMRFAACFAFSPLPRDVFSPIAAIAFISLHFIFIITPFFIIFITFSHFRH
jgi:hypothetical protein